MFHSHQAFLYFVGIIWLTTLWLGRLTGNGLRWVSAPLSAATTTPSRTTWGRWTWWRSRWTTLLWLIGDTSGRLMQCLLTWHDFTYQQLQLFLGLRHSRRWIPWPISLGLPNGAKGHLVESTASHILIQEQIDWQCRLQTTGRPGFTGFTPFRGGNGELGSSIIYLTAYSYTRAIGISP